jgi:hypothetical protein
MKRIIFLLLFGILFLTFSIAVSASGTAITVVIPKPEIEKGEIPAVTTAPVSYLYPSKAEETAENGRREVVKTYELGAGEKPDNISQESFERDGWLYELADITKQETSSNSSRKHTEIVTLETASNDTTEILKQLNPTKNYKASDGFSGVLSLNISSIKVESAGTKSSSYTVKATREYPHLSSNDTSLIPKSITESGRTLTLSNIQWRAQNVVAVDYEQLPDSYTAVASYTGTGYKTYVTGYVTTAEYSGTLIKSVKGKTVYKAYFTGTQIVLPEEMTELSTTSVPETTAEPVTTPVETTITEPETTAVISTAMENETVTEIETTVENAAESDVIAEQKSLNYIPLVIFFLMFGVVAGGVLMWLYFTKCKKRKENLQNENQEIG